MSRHSIAFTEWIAWGQLFGDRPELRALYPPIPPYPWDAWHQTLLSLITLCQTPTLQRGSLSQPLSPLLCDWGIAQLHHYPPTMEGLRLFILVLQWGRSSLLMAPLPEQEQNYFTLISHLDRLPAFLYDYWYRTQQPNKNQELLRVNQLLSQEKRQYLEIFEHLEDAIFIFDHYGSLINLNEKAIDYFSPRSPLHDSLKVIGQVSLPWLESRIAHCRQQACHLYKETLEIPTVFGTSLFILSLHELRDCDRGASGWMAILKNIDSLHQCEVKLQKQEKFQETEALLKVIIEMDVAGLLVLNQEGKVLFVNSAAEKLLNHPKHKIIGEVLGFPLINNEAAEINIPQGDGSFTTAMMRAATITWQQDQALLVSLMDITAYRQIQEKYQVLFQASEQSPASIIITNAEGNIEYVNPKFAEITGYERQEVIGQNPRILKSGYTSKEEYEILWETLSSGQEWHGEFHNRRKNGELFWERASISPIKNEEGIITHFVAVKEDITLEKESEERLSHQANYDALTDLPNRHLAFDRLRQSLSHADRHHRHVAVMFLDLDHFKKINDTLGHHWGDALLVETAQRLRLCLRKSDTVARLGGDEFLAILPDLDHPQQCEVIAKKILESLSQPFELQGESNFISTSIGITIYPQDGTDPNILLRNADTAMYRAKQMGRNDFKFFTPIMNVESQNRLRLESYLRYALTRGEFELFYQPFVCLKSGQLMGAEALLRWQNSILGTVSPETFVPVAEDMGLIGELGEWVLNQACQDAKFFQQYFQEFYMAVNLSPRQFRTIDFLKEVELALNNTNFDPRYLELEITERLMLEDIPGVTKILEQLRSRHIRLSLDDFGTGYSALNYLRRFPFEVLKIDRSFIQDIPHHEEARALVKAIINMAHGLRLKVIAEGVENREQYEFLRDQGCDLGQGFWLGYPMPKQQFQNRWFSHSDVLETPR